MIILMIFLLEHESKQTHNMLKPVEIANFYYLLGMKKIKNLNHIFLTFHNIESEIFCGVTDDPPIPLMDIPRHSVNERDGAFERML